MTHIEFRTQTEADEYADYLEGESKILAYTKQQPQHLVIDQLRILAGKARRHRMLDRNETALLAAYAPENPARAL